MCNCRPVSRTFSITLIILIRAKSRHEKLTSPRSSKYLLLKDVVDDLIPVGIMRGRVDRAEFTSGLIHIHTKSNGSFTFKVVYNS